MYAAYPKHYRNWPNTGTNFSVCIYISCLPFYCIACVCNWLSCLWSRICKAYKVAVCVCSPHYTRIPALRVALFLHVLLFFHRNLRSKTSRLCAPTRRHNSESTPVPPNLFSPVYWTMDFFFLLYAYICTSFAHSFYGIR